MTEKYCDNPHQTCPYCEHPIDCWVTECPHSANLLPGEPPSNIRYVYQYYEPPRAPPWRMVQRGPSLCERIGDCVRNSVNGCRNSILGCAERALRAKESCCQALSSATKAMVDSCVGAITCNCCYTDTGSRDYEIYWERKCPPGCTCPCHENIAYAAYSAPRYARSYQGRVLPGQLNLCPQHSPVSTTAQPSEFAYYAATAAPSATKQAAQTAAPEIQQGAYSAYSSVWPTTNEYTGPQHEALGCGKEAQERSGWNRQIEELSTRQPLYVYTAYLPPGISPDDPRLQEARVVSLHTYVTDHLDFPAQDFCGYIDPQCQTDIVGGRTVAPASTGTRDIPVGKRGASAGSTATTTVGGEGSQRPSLGAKPEPAASRLPTNAPTGSQAGPAQKRGGTEDSGEPSPPSESAG